MLPMHHPAKTMQFLDRLNNDCGYLMGGGPGGVLAGAFVRGLEYLDPRRTDVLEAHFQRLQTRVPYSYLQRIFSREFLAEYDRKLRDSFVETWASLKGSTAAHRATAWGMVIRQPAFTFTSPIHNHPYSAEATAHLGYSYSDLMLKLPANWLYDRNFYRYMIFKKIPHLRDIVYANTGQLLSGQLERYTAPEWHPHREWMIRQVRRPLSRARRMVSPLAHLMKNMAGNSPKPDFNLSVMSRDVKLVNEVKALLDLPNIPAFLDLQQCRAFLSDFGTSRESNAHIFGCLASMCFTAKQDA
jgi:hypothetical protein